jgi:hypothetical protein
MDRSGAEMIVVRNVFKLKFGKAREAVTLWKQGIAIADRVGFEKSSTRLLTDLVGPFYTLVMESTHESLGDYERSAKKLMESKEWKAWYAGVPDITEGGYREVFVVAE